MVVEGEDREGEQGSRESGDGRRGRERGEVWRWEWEEGRAGRAGERVVDACGAGVAAGAFRAVDVAPQVVAREEQRQVA